MEKKKETWSICTAGKNGYVVSANFSNTVLTLVMMRGADAGIDDAEDIFISIFRGFFHPFAEKFAGAERIRVVSC